MCKKKQNIGRSSYYILSRIKNGKCNGVNVTKEDLIEVKFDDIVTGFINIETLNAIKFDNTIQHVIAMNIDGKNIERKFTIIYDPNAIFDYFTTQRCVCDGTTVAYESLVSEILTDIMLGRTFCKANVPHDYKDNWFNYDIVYTVGNFVFAKEYGEQFAPQDKIWMCSRITAMLPIKFEAIKRK